MLPGGIARRFGQARPDDQPLARIEQCIVDGEVRITRLAAVIDRLASNGHDTSQAEDLLCRFEDVLEMWIVRRRSVMRAIPN